LSVSAAHYSGRLQIGERLGIASATVNKHLESIYERLDVHTRTAAAAAVRGASFRRG